MKLRYALYLFIPFWITGLLLTSAWLANRPLDNHPPGQGVQPLLASTAASTSHTGSLIDNPTAQRYFYHETFATQQAKANAVDVDWNSIAHHLTLALRHNQPQQDAIVVTDDAQHRYVVWQDLRYDSGDIYAQSLDAAGNPLWPTDRLVNQVMTDTLQAAPTAIVDGTGNLVVAWVDQRNGQSDIYAQKLNVKGDTVWLEDIRIHQESGNTDQGAPVLAIRPDGSMVIVWHDNRNGDYDLFAQQIDGEGVRQWDADVRVNSDNSTQSQAEPTVRIVAPDQALVVWLDQRIGNSDLYAQGLTGAGQRIWGQDLRINPAADSAQTRPALTELPTGEALVAWVGVSNEQIAIQKVSLAGTLLWPAPKSIQLAGQIIDVESAPGLLTLGNTAIVAWRVLPDDQLYAQRLDAAGSEQWSNPVQITQLGNSLAMLRQLGPGAIDGEAVLFAWPAVRSNGQQGIYSQQLNSDGSVAWAEEERISAASGTVDQMAPALAVAADGHTVVAWQDGRTAVPALYAQRIAPDGQLLWRDQIGIQQHTLTTTAQSLPSVAMIEEDAVVAWADARSGQKRVYTQHLDQLGHRLRADVPTSRAQTGNASQLNPAIAASPGNMIVAWEEWRDQQRLILAQRINTEGNPQWPADVVVSDPATNARLPALAVDAVGYTTLVWSVSTADQTDLFSQRLDPNGSPVWAQPIRVNGFAGLVDPLNPPALAVAASNAQQGDVTVVWVDRRQGDVYAQRLNATGKPVWAQDIALTTPPSAGIPNPTVAMAADGSAVIAWQGITPGGHQTILAQRLDNTGQVQWQSVGAPALLVSPAIRSGSHPRIAIDRNGNSVIAWQEQRQMNPDVYVQRLDATGKQLWAADRLIVAADRFYVTQGRVRSQPIDIVDASISQALLTAHFDRQGGTIEFQLSNDNGAHWATVQPGISHLFTTTGSSLRWQASLRTPTHRLQTPPVLHEVMIEYTTGVAPTGDTYEADNSCADAHPLLVNSAAQAHTLPATLPLDEDWLQLAVAANQTYTLIVSAQTYDPALTAAVYTSCGTQALAAQTVQDGTALYVSFTSSFTTTYYTRIGYTHAGATQSALAYTVRLQQETAPGLAIIVAGALASPDSQQTLINMAANHAYLTLLRHGYKAEQIDYLNPLRAQDVDGNGAQDDIDVAPSLSELSAALQRWGQVLNRGPDVPLIIYLVGRFTGDQFFLNDQQALTSATLDRLLVNLEETTAANQIILVLEGSYSGSWIDPQPLQAGTQPAGQWWSVSGPNRVVIASTSSGAAAWPSAHGLLFSDAFWTALSMGYNLYQSFQIGQAIGQTAGCVWPDTPSLCQTPWLDDSGAGAPNSGQDGHFATSWSLASPNRSVPQIINVTTARAQVGLALRVTVLNSAQLSGLAAHLVRPDVQPVWASNAFPTRDLTVVTLNPSLATTTDTAGVVVYTGFYTQAVPPGTIVIVYGWDTHHLPILSRAVSVDSQKSIYLPVIQK